MKEKSLRDQLVDLLSTLPVGTPSVIPETTADEFGVTRRAVEWWLNKLDEEGAIVWHRKTRGGRRRPWWPVTVVDLQKGAQS